MNSIWTIYALLEPDSKEVRYVGYTRRTVADRLKYHEWDSRRAGRVQKVSGWIRSLRRRKQSPALAVLQVGTGDWQNAEKFWIASFGNAGMKLLNMTVGGRGVKR